MRSLGAVHEGRVCGQHGAEGEPFAALAALVRARPGVLVEVVSQVGQAVVRCRALWAQEGVPGENPSCHFRAIYYLFIEGLQPHPINGTGSPQSPNPSCHFRVI